jgi:hypothetical protein
MTIRIGRRDNETQRRDMITRSLRIRASTADDAKRTVQVTLATEAPVRVWDWELGIVDEVLRMDGVELPDQVPMLADHESRDIEAIRGSLRGLRVEDELLNCAAHFASDEDATRAWQKVRDGHLTDLSVGYEILQRGPMIPPGQTATVAGRSYTAGAVPLVITLRWRPFEGSLVPVGADQASKVRAHHHHRATAPQENAMKFADWLKARGINPESLTEAQRTALTADFEAMQRAALPPTNHTPPPAGDEAARAAELRTARERADKAERRSELLGLARAHNVEITDAEIDGFADVASGLRALLERKAKKDQNDNQPLTGVGGISVQRDAADKFFARAQAGMLRSAAIEVKGEHKDAQPLSSREVIARCALHDGHSDARDWSDVDMNMYAARNARYVRSGGPNKTTSMFTTLLSNTADKVLLAGFDGYDDITYEQWCTVGETNSFKTFTVAGLSTALLQIVAEGAAAKELEQKEGAYSSKLGVYGGTIRLSFQTITDDELGVFMESVRRIGANARRTIEVEAYRSLLNGTYTSDTTTSAPIGTAGKLDTVRADFRKKKNPSAANMNASPRFLLHDPAIASAVDQALGISVPPGGTQAAGTRVRSIVPIESALISDTTLLAGALSTTYFLTGDPRLLDTVRVTMLRGVRSPIFMEFDQGASFGQGFKAFLPMVATQATHSDGTNTRATGLQKATA